MSKVITVNYEVKEEEVEETVVKQIEDPAINEELNKLFQKRQELLNQLAEIDKQIDNLRSKLIVTETKKVKKSMIYIKCPVCNCQIKLVGRQFRGRIRCKCGSILLVQ